MSFSVRGGILQNTIKIGGLYSHMTTRIQGAMAQVAKEGLEYMRNEADLPIDTAALQESTASGVNQAAIWFRYAIEPQGDGHPYGPAQNYGWHDRGGTFHQGHFFAEKTEIFAQRRLRQEIALAWSDAQGIGGGRYADPLEARIVAGTDLRDANPEGVSSSNLNNPYG